MSTTYPLSMIFLVILIVYACGSLPTDMVRWIVKKMRDTSRQTSQRLAEQDFAVVERFSV